MNPESFTQLVTSVLVGVGFVAFLAWLMRYLHQREDQQKQLQRERRDKSRLGAGVQKELELARLRMLDRSEARALFERLSMEKLEVLKTSIQMGYRQADLAELDARLERIIGSEKLAGLLGEVLPEPDGLPSADLAPETEARRAGVQHSALTN